MKLTLKIALRYIFTRRSFQFITIITLLSQIGIIVGIAALICVMSIFNGFREFAQKQLISFDPHIRITARQGAYFEADSAVTDKLSQFDEIKAFSFMLQSKVIISKKSVIQPVILNCIDKKQYKYISDIATSLIYGRFTISDNNGDYIVLGCLLADKLRAMPNDTLNIMSPKMLENSIKTYSQPEKISIPMSGMFQTHSKEYDELSAYTSIAMGRKIFKLSSKSINSIDIKLNSIDESNEMKEKLQQIFPDYDVKTWYDLHKDLYNVMQFERLATFIVLSLIISIAVFNILASLTMTVVEKKSDIALLKALGAENKQIRNIFLLTGSIIGISSTIIGTVVGLGLCFGQINYRWFKLDTSKYIIDAIPVSVNSTDIAAIIAFAIILSLLATVYPSLRASQTNIIESLREE